MVAYDAATFSKEYIHRVILKAGAKEKMSRTLQVGIGDVVLLHYQTPGQNVGKSLSDQKKSPVILTLIVSGVI